MTLPYYLGAGALGALLGIAIRDERRRTIGVTPGGPGGRGSGGSRTPPVSPEDFRAMDQATRARFLDRMNNYQKSVLYRQMYDLYGDENDQRFARAYANLEGSERLIRAADRPRTPPPGAEGPGAMAPPQLPPTPTLGPTPLAPTDFTTPAAPQAAPVATAPRVPAPVATPGRAPVATPGRAPATTPGVMPGQYGAQAARDAAQIQQNRFTWNPPGTLPTAQSIQQAIQSAPFQTGGAGLPSIPGGMAPTIAPSDAMLAPSAMPASAAALGRGAAGVQRIGKDSFFGGSL